MKRHAIGTAAAIGATSLLVACGGSSDEDSGDQRAEFEDAQLEFAQCMRENGVDLPDPETGGDGGEGGGFFFGPDSEIDPQSESFQAAQEECGSILDEAIPAGERPDPAEIRDQLHVMTECLRDRGYDVPEPQIIGPGENPPENPREESQGFREELDRLQDDPEFQQAREDCTEEAGLPAGGPDNEGG